MSKELIERLRAIGYENSEVLIADAAEINTLVYSAADRIEELERENWSLIREKAPVLVDTRRERDALQADNARLREALTEFLRNPGGDYTEEIAEEALAATPEQSLARIRNQVREEIAKEMEKALLEGHEHMAPALIHATKEPE